MKLWIARDKDGCAFVYKERPRRLKDRFTGCYLFLWGYIPSVTWENSPQQVELILSEEYNRLKECEEICKTESDYSDKHYC